MKPKTLLFIHGGKVLDDAPTAHFLVRTRAALDYYATHKAEEEVVFLVSGRWLSATEDFIRTEAEIGKRYILQAVPDATVIKEDISVELVGNYAFSKPLIMALNPDKAVIFTTELLEERTELITKRIFASDVPYEIRYLPDTVTNRTNSSDREQHALELFMNLFAGIEDGDDAAFRNTLLYATPYYFKGIIDDKTYFDRNWKGGFENYLHSRRFYKTS